MSEQSRSEVQVALSDEASVELGDERRRARHGLILEDISSCASSSFPRIFADKAALEGFYRFVGNGAFDDRSVFSGHISQTVDRCREAGDLMVAHDTTSVRYPLHDDDWLRENLGRPSTQTQGYELHASMVMQNTSGALPLGVLNATPFVHAKHVAHSDDAQTWWQKRDGLFDNESKRWFDGVRNVAERLGEHAARAIHVMDREGDSYAMLDWLSHEQHRFVIRAKSLSRPVVAVDGNDLDQPITLSEALAQSDFVCETSAQLGFRTPFRNQRRRREYPPRKSRTTTLSARACRVTLRNQRICDIPFSPRDKIDIARRLSLSIVEVVERTPPAGASAVRWVLLTSEPVETAEQILAVVATYRRRWIIEEYFKALKSGCALEKRQMDNAGRLLKVLALLMPIAWSLLLARTLDDQDDDAPWHLLLEPMAFLILSRAMPKLKLSETSTAVDTLRAVAALGGHIKNNGPPGWLTIQRGMETLALLAFGAQLANELSVQEM